MINPIPDKAVIPLIEHPIYGRFIKMLKLGLPKEYVEIHMKLTGLNTAILTLDPSTLIDININNNTFDELFKK